MVIKKLKIIKNNILLSNKNINLPYIAYRDFLKIKITYNLYLYFILKFVFVPNKILVIFFAHLIFLILDSFYMPSKHATLYSLVYKNLKKKDLRLLFNF